MALKNDVVIPQTELCIRIIIIVNNMLLLRIAFISWTESRNMQYNFIVMFKIHFKEYQYQNSKNRKMAQDSI